MGTKQMTQYDDRASNMHPFYTAEQAKAMNYAFAKAMLLARKAGAERFAIGVRVDDTPFVPTSFAPAPRASFMQSAAALCAESAPGHE